ncbi:MAG: ral secretion pathway protein [Desulfovibrionales bacterium]|jgi:general secretion pathway protein G|nr:ral secretion pathway protein [Desulfovibrionales bacterium]
MNNDAKKRRTISKARGFTLIELMIVIVILGILSTLVILNIAGAPDEARVTKAKTDMQTLQSALILFKVQNGFYPSTEQGLKALIQKPVIKPIPRNYPQGGYLNQQTVPKDPWGNEYIYRSPGGDNRPYEIITLGADNMEGGEGFDADLKSYETNE